MINDNINLGLIIQNCKKGNRNSQRKLYEYFYGYAMNIALRYTKHKNEALEILNDGFLKAFLNLEKYDSEFPFRIWLRKILTNAAIDYYRSQRKHLKFVELTEVKEFATEPTPLPNLSSDEDILPVIQQLPPAYRMVFNLFVMEGYKHQEIAEMLDIKVSTSKSNLVRAKAKLREILLQQENSLVNSQ